MCVNRVNTVTVRVVRVLCSFSHALKWPYTRCVILMPMNLLQVFSNNILLTTLHNNTTTFEFDYRIFTLLTLSTTIQKSIYQNRKKKKKKANTEQRSRTTWTNLHLKGFILINKLNQNDLNVKYHDHFFSCVQCGCGRLSVKERKRIAWQNKLAPRFCFVQKEERQNWHHS